ncbi:MAG: hypothetical protein Q9214_004278 [Letrouitia sp. 1 TL-2023]
MERYPNESIIRHKAWWGRGVGPPKTSRTGCVDKIIERQNNLIAIHEKKIEILAKRQAQTINGLERRIREKDKVIEGLRFEIQVIDAMDENLKWETQAADETFETLRQETEQEQEKAIERIRRLELQVINMNSKRTMQNS